MRLVFFFILFVSFVFIYLSTFNYKLSDDYDEDAISSLTLTLVPTPHHSSLHPGSNDLKSIKSVTSRAFDLLYANYNYQKFSLCDWVIEPKELADYSTFETNKSKMDQLFEIGYNEAKKSYENLAT